jgi:LysR family transcriptional regulator, nod-box dependent transcriptional activator
MRFDGLDLNLLVVLDVLLDTQNVTETARRLNLSQPSVSAALGRLRRYFDDPLLTQIGRKLLPTAKGQDLAPAIKELLTLVRFRIAQADGYAPLESQRRFSVIASDYAYDVVLSKVIARAERLAPGVTFEITPTGPAAVRRFQNGDIDVLITVANYTVVDHPHLPLFSDEDSVICWNLGAYAGGIDAAQFLEASHAIAVFGEERRPTVSDLHFDSSGIERRIAVQVPGFSALPGAVVGTDRVAILHRRHARFFSSLYPISHHPLPVPGPGISEVVQWHRLRDKDPGARWLIGLLVDEARDLPQPA